MKDVAQPIDPASPLETDVPCIQCGYNLRGLWPDHHCPECHTPIERSLCGDELRFADPRWLAKVSHGLRLMVLAWTLLLVGAVVFVLCIVFLGRLASGPAATQSGMDLLTGLFILVADAGLALLAIGVWSFTAREPAAQRTAQPLQLRPWLRLAPFAVSLAITLPLILSSTGISPAILATGGLWLAALSVAGLMMGSSINARWLAQRVPAPDLAAKMTVRARSFANVVLAAVVLITIALLSSGRTLPLPLSESSFGIGVWLILLAAVIADRGAAALRRLRTGIRECLATARRSTPRSGTKAEESDTPSRSRD